MRKLVLTQGQVSLVLSGGTVLLFTFLLFLAGYTAQQRTVQGLRAGAKPRIPPPPATLVPPTNHENQKPELKSSRLFGKRGQGQIVYANSKNAQSSVEVDWKRLAHIQLARTHHDVCNAIMVLAEFHRQKSPARRLLMFPEAWAAEKHAGKGGTGDPFVDSSRRLMKLATRRYGVELRPVKPFMTSVGEDGVGDIYSLASAYDLSDLDRVLSLETPGLIMDASALDALLGYTEQAPFAMLYDTSDDDGVHAEDLILLQPSIEVHQTLKQSLRTRSAFNDSQLAEAFSDQLLLQAPSEDAAVVRSIGMLHDVDEHFSATAYISQASYLRFSDPKMPGPEYDVPFTQKRDARPTNKDADWTWTKLYGEFEQKRMEVCGLDLESWRPG